MRWEIFNGLVRHGRARMASHAGALVLHLCPDVFKSLDYDRDAYFQSPFLFAMDAATPDRNAVALSLLAQSMHSAGRFVASVRVEPNSEGVVFIPALGFLDVGSDRDIVIRDVHGETWLIERAGVPEQSRLRPIHTVGRFPFGLVEHATPLFGDAPMGVHGNSLRLAPADFHRGSPPAPLIEALEILSAACPELYTGIEMSSEYFVLLSRPDIRSFTAERLPGVIFLSCPQQPTLPFFLEEITHQCGHTALSAAAFGHRLLFEQDESLPIASITGDESDHRSIYVVLHGLFTEVMIAHVLEAALTMDLLPHQARLEAAGRLGLALQKYSADRANAAALPYLTSYGDAFCREIVRLGDRLCLSTEHLRAGLDLAGQPYDFDLDCFLRRNAGRDGAQLQSVSPMDRDSV
jgi:HEXXH motif-containing protein